MGGISCRQKAATDTGQDNRDIRAPSGVRTYNSSVGAVKSLQAIDSAATVISLLQNMGLCVSSECSCPVTWPIVLAIRLILFVFNPLQANLQTILYTPFYNICALLGIVQFAEVCTFLKVQIMTNTCIRIEFVIDVKSTVRYSNSFRSGTVHIIQCVLKDQGTSRLEIYKKWREISPINEALCRESARLHLKD
jgi:hypothetical protein